MPLVVLTGYPCSGKSEVARQLKEHLVESWNCTVHVISDDFDKFPRNECYISATKEKECRATLKSSAERLLNTKDVVIIDSLNYIKGFRYELYCVVRQMKTVHCIVQSGTSPEQCREWNNTREDPDKYSEDTLTALIQRYEPPNSCNRWDSPLFIFLPGEPPPLEEIARAVLEQAPKPPKQSTQSQPLSSVDFMQELDQQTKAIVSFIVDNQRTCHPPCSITPPSVKIPIQIPRNVTLAELNRLRRQFVTYTKLHPVKNIDELQTLFVQYLNNTL